MVRIPGTTVSIEVVQVPAPPGASAPLWFGRTEITWEAYDVFVYGLDEPGGTPGATGADAAAQPSKPYVPPDRGFGHNGFPAMGMTRHAAEAFCAWLSARTGKKFRLPTEAEWEHACLGGTAGPFACGAESACLLDLAWFAENSDRTTKAVATKKPNAYGLHDVHGNVAEWVMTTEGKPLAKGGSYLDPAARCAASDDLRQSSSWNASDPQVPKITWWLADCSFVGFRIVMEGEAGIRN